MVSIELVYVVADPATLKPMTVPSVLRERIRAFEAVAPDQTGGPRDAAN
jgi:hypothetical protein